jgi:hypothetical protein
MRRVLSQGLYQTWGRSHMLIPYIRQAHRIERMPVSGQVESGPLSSPIRVNSGARAAIIPARISERCHVCSASY